MFFLPTTTCSTSTSTSLGCLIHTQECGVLIPIQPDSKLIQKYIEHLLQWWHLRIYMPSNFRFHQWCRVKANVWVPSMAQVVLLHILIYRQGWIKTWEDIPEQLLLVWKCSWFWLFTHFGAIKSPRPRLNENLGRHSRTTFYHFGSVCGRFYITALYFLQIIVENFLCEYL